MRRTFGAQLTAAVAATGIAGSAASAQLLTNADFESGLDGWTVTPTPFGAGAPGTTEVFDIDGAGPLTPSSAAKFAVGDAAESPLGDAEGIFLSQTVQLTAGVTYMLGFDWAAVNLGSFANLDSGTFDVMINGQFLDGGQGNAGGLVEFTSISGTVRTSYTSLTTGPQQFQVRIVRVFGVPQEPPGTPSLWQYVDNVHLEAVPAPSTGVLLIAGAGGLLARRRRPE